MTNAEWTDLAKGLGEDRYVLLRHDSNTGETRIERKGKTAEELLPEDLGAEAKGIQFDQGGVMIEGSLVLLKMVDKPSAIYDEEGRSFSGLPQPVVGVTYFHTVTWALLKSHAEGGRYQYDLPTDGQQQYVSSNAGTCKYGTEACTSLFKGERKLAHIDEDNDGKGTTVAVNDPRYEQKLPFGVQTTGNVWRWVKFNPAETWRYGLRGGSWGYGPGGGQASFRNDLYGPDDCYNDVGFSVVRQDCGIFPDLPNPRCATGESL